MLNTHTFFLIIAGLTLLNAELVHAGGSFSSEQKQGEQLAREQEALLAAQRERQQAELAKRQEEAQRARREDLERKEMLKHHSREAAKEALKALPAIYQGYLQERPLPKDPDTVKEGIKFAFRLTHQQYYTQMIVREYLAQKRLERHETDLTLTPEEEVLAERSGRVAAQLFCDEKRNPEIEEVQETYRIILQKDRNTLSGK